MLNEKQIETLLNFISYHAGDDEHKEDLPTLKEITDKLNPPEKLKAEALKGE